MNDTIKHMFIVLVSNSYCRAMTRFGIKPCWKISNYFQFSVKIFFSVLWTYY